MRDARAADCTDVTAGTLYSKDIRRYFTAYARISAGEAACAGTAT